MSARQQPPWTKPASSAKTLRILNSLTRDKDEFVPQSGNVVRCYTCGPTVYDASHMGHARSYITFDIIRRLLTEYFNYEVMWVMNITDIDDKIILRARRNHLFSVYSEKKHTLEEVLADVREALPSYEAKMNALQAADPKDPKVGVLASAIAAAKGVTEASGATVESVLAGARDPLADYLDKKHGQDVTDNEIFVQTARHWESEFHKDMAALNVLPADVLTRVSEYVPEIVAYVDKIVQRGFGYEAQGSVYFDTAKFDGSEGHAYGKLMPESIGNLTSLAEGEGELSSGGGKRSKTDFALWKASKPGEPAWDSPWGRGRPGWHIECSAMASEIIGSVLDIHCGGIDLRFPHHENELAQAEAHYDCNQWTNYFLHAGHLEIDGQKMSKSFKNFQTIQDALKLYTARQLRLMFLMHKWNDTLGYSAETMRDAVNLEKAFTEFFLNVKASVAGLGNDNGGIKWTSLELDFDRKFREAQDAVHGALCDNFDTHTAFLSLKELVGATNTYLRDTKQAANGRLLGSIGRYVTRIFSAFGLIERTDTLGFGSQQANADVESIMAPFLQSFGAFRDTVRQNAREQKNVALLRLCDDVRDRILPDLGVRLEDREGQPAAVKFVGAEEIARQRKEEAAQKEAKEEAARKKAEEDRRKQEEKNALSAIPPEKLFTRETDKYSKFDDKGIPTHDVEGKEVSKSQRKKCEKAHEAQIKLHAAYRDSHPVPE
eukprot:Opistho-2@18564